MPEESLFPYRQQIVVFCGKTGTGKTTLANLTADKMEQISGIRPLVGSTDQFKRQPMVPRALTPEERLSRYTQLSQWLSQQLNEHPGRPIFLQGMFDHPDFRNAIEKAAKQNQVHYVEIRAPAQVAIERLEKAEKKGKDRGGSVANSQMLKESRGWPKFQKLDNRFALVNNPASKTESQLGADAERIAKNLIGQSMAERVTQKRIQVDFARIDQTHRSPLAKLRAALSLARDWFNLKTDGSIALWGIHPNKAHPYVYDQLKMWAAIYPQPPHGAGFSAMKRHGMQDFVISIADYERRRTSLYYRGGQPAHVTQFGGGTFDPKIHKALGRGGGNLPHGFYFPLGLTTKEEMEAGQPYSSAPHWYEQTEEPFEPGKGQGHLGIAASYSASKRTEEMYKQMEAFFGLANPWMTRWMREHLTTHHFGQSTFRETAKNAEKMQSGNSKTVTALAARLCRKIPTLNATERTQIRAAARLLPLVQAGANPQQLLPTHSPNHPLVSALVGFQQLNGTPQAVMVDSQGREKAIADLGEFGRPDAEQRRKIQNGQLFPEDAWTHNIRQTSIHSGNVEKAEAFQENRTQNGSFDSSDIINIANNMYRLHSRQLEPDQIPVSAHILHAAWLLERRCGKKQRSIEKIAKAQLAVVKAAQKARLDPQVVSAIGSVRARAIQRALKAA